MVLTLTQEAWNEIARHAAETFPEECCGIILSHGKSDEVRRCANIQNSLHARDPENFPRDATIAYSMDMKELDSVLQEAETSGAKIKAFYHSHPDHDAYFSDEDKAAATPFGEPTFPESAQIVVSIYDRTVKTLRAFAWSPERKSFVAIPLQRA